MEPIAGKSRIMHRSQVSKEAWEDANRHAIGEVGADFAAFGDGYTAPKSIGNANPPVADFEWTSRFRNSLPRFSYLHADGPGLATGTYGLAYRYAKERASLACSYLLLEGMSVYRIAPLRIIDSPRSGYATRKDPDSNGTLFHAVYGKTQGNGVDECNIWGDYLCMEALSRLCDDTPLFW